MRVTMVYDLRTDFVSRQEGFLTKEVWHDVMRVMMAYGLTS